MTRGGALVRNAALIAVAKIAVQAAAFLLLPVYTSRLSPSEFGVLELTLAYAGLIAPILLLQFDAAVFRLLLDSRDDFAELRRTLSTVCAVAILGIAVLALLSVGLAMAGLDVLSAASVVVASFMALSLAQQTARGLGQMGVYVVSSLASGAGVIIGNLTALLVLETGVWGVLLGTASGYLLGALVACCGSRIWQYVRWSAISASELRRCLRYSLPLIPNGASWWSIDAGGRAILGIAQGLTVVGVFGVANRFAQLFSQLFSYFNLAWIESASHNMSAGDRDTYFSAVFNRCLRACSGVVLVLIAALPLYFPWFVGEQFDTGISLVPVLLLGALFNAWVTLYSSIYVALKETRAVLNTTIIAAVVALGLGAALVLPLGAFGIAFASCASWILVLLLRHRHLRRRINLVYSPLTWLSLCMTVCVAVVASLLLLNGYRWMGGFGAAGGVLVAVLLNFGLLKEMIVMLRGRMSEREATS